MLGDWFTPDEKNHFLNALTEVDRQAEMNFSTKFVNCTVEKQTEHLEKLEKESLAIINNNPPQTGQNSILKPFFSQIKELTLIGYYTSEIGATRELKYFRASMNYDGCVPMKEIGRAWSNQ